ncbi:MAG: cob(I)alamin adenosyltransferase, partial [Pseudonocardiales bacterium]|nr:cob(I)alamin adenosyltransferase [Pseudonocardiales bacterium]
WAIGEGFSWDSEDLDQDQAVAKAAWAHARALIEAGEHQLIVLDEITYPINWGWLEATEVVGVIRDRPAHVTVVCTGRDAPEGLVDIADTVTEMRKVKHVYDTGVFAMKGVDF